MQFFQRIQQAKYLQQPDDKDDHNNRVEYILDGALHGDVGIYQPENNTDNNQNK
jgi:hypothetical protein